MKRKIKVKKIPRSFRPLLWSLRWKDLDIDDDKADIIVNTINEGTLAQWRWIRETYGKETIRRVMAKRLVGEFHPESLNLATIAFHLSPLRYASRGAHAKSGRVVSQTR